MIGSGVAGLRAALQASKRVGNVHLVSKHPVGRASNTYYSGGGILSAKPGGLSVREHFTRTVESGRFLNNQTLVKTLVEGIPGVMRELIRLGVKLHPRSPETEYLVDGRFWEWGGALLDAHLRLIGDSLRFHENVSIFKLLTRGGRVIGALGYDHQRNRFVAFRAKAIALCSGGLGGLYSRSTNAPGHVGEGYSMAYDAGAKLRDMEFVQFLGLTVEERPMYRLSRLVGALCNRLGEDVLIKHGLSRSPRPSDDPALFSRDRLAIAMMKEISGGLGVDGAILMDLSQEERWRSDLRSSESVPFLLKQFGDERMRVRVIPSAHFSIGGVAIDALCRTGVEGLYAAGEVTGGAHGANRVSGNALAEGLVFGGLAGSSAAAYSSSVEAVPIERTAEEEVTEFEGLMSRSGGASPEAVLRKIQDLMWKHVGVLRVKEGLEEAVGELEGIGEDEVPRLGAASPEELLAALEVLNGWTTALAVAKAALLREESRGAHHRTDFPVPGDDWVKNIFIERRGESMQATTRPVVTVDPSDVQELDG